MGIETAPGINPTTAPTKAKVTPFLVRHLRALEYVLRHVVPEIFRTGRRPVLFEKNSGIGDIICTFPAAYELKKRHEGAPCIYNSHRDYTYLAKFGGVTQHTTGFKEIGLVGYWYRWLLAGYYAFVSDDDDVNALHRELYLHDFARNVGVTVSGEHPRLEADSAGAARMEALLKKRNPSANGPRILIHPGPTWPVKEWPQESWAALVEGLRTHGYANIIQLGVGRVLRFGETAVTPVPGVFSLVNQLSLEESIALISTADLFIGLDSGLLHIAAALRIPAIGLWGFTTPTLRFSETVNQQFIISPISCRGCHHRIPRLHWFSNCPYNIECMQMIKPQTVLAACLLRLSAPIAS